MTLQSSIVEHTFDFVRKHWADEQLEPNFVDVMSALRGWSPLAPGESMIVTYGDAGYEIHRLPKATPCLHQRIMAEPCLHQRITTVAGHMGPVCGDCGVMV